MTIKAYLDCVAAIPLPSVEQTNRFAREVRRAHSWYKRLPTEKPGVVFTFLLDPFRAGRSKENDDVILKRFGHWCFWASDTENELIQMNGIVVPQEFVETCSRRFTACLFDDGDGYSRSWRGVLHRRMGGKINDEELDILLDEAGKELNDALLVASMLFERYCLRPPS
jgi:hypothetical protein